MKLLVQFDEKNYVMKADSLKSIDELKSHIKENLTNAPSFFDVQYFDEDFKTYVQLTSIDEIGNKAMLKLEKVEAPKQTNGDVAKRKVLSPSTSRKVSIEPDDPLPTSSKQNRQSEEDVRGIKRKRQDETSNVKRQTLDDVSKVLLAAGALPNFLPDRKKGQTNEEIEKLKRYMRKEVTSKNPEYAKVSQALDHTLSDRRNYIVNEQHTVDERHRCYPWLFTEKEIIREFSRICNEDMMMKDKLFSYFCKISGPVYKCVKDNKSRDIMKRLSEQKFAKHDTKAAKEAIYTMALVGIPNLLNENIEHLFVKETTNCNTISRISIHYSGDEPYYNPGSYKLCVDGRHITLTSRRRAVCASLGAHYAFNIGYCNQLFNFFTFIESEIFRLKTCKGAPATVRQMMKALKTEATKESSG